MLADPVQGPGHAIVVLEGSEIESAGEISFSIARNQDGRFLTADGQWEPTQAWHEPQEYQLDQTVVRCWVGTQVVDALLANPQMQYRIIVKGVEQSFQGIMRLGTDLFPSSARAAASVPTAAVVPPEPEPEPEPVIDTAVPEAPAAIEPAAVPVSEKSRAVPVLLALLVLAIIGAGLWWFLLNGGKSDPVGVVQETVQTESPADEPATDEAPTPVAEVSEPAAVPCAVDALAQVSDDIAYLQRCVQSQPTTEQIFSIIEAGKASQKCDLIQRLYAHAAQSGNVEVALAYAKEFDPLTFEGGCFAAPEPETAVYWYEIYLQTEPDDQAVATRAQSLKE